MMSVRSKELIYLFGEIFPKVRRTSKEDPFGKCFGFPSCSIQIGGPVKH